MDRITFSELEEMSTERIIELITEKRISVLQTYGKTKLYRSLLPVRWIVKLAMKLFFRHNALKLNFYDTEKIDLQARANAVKLLKKFTPYKAEMEHSPMNAAHGSKVPMVIGFNHPSLGEIARLMALCFDYYRHQRLVFPVTLPWFEMFAPYKRYFDGLGVKITPIVTPHATETLLEGLACDHSKRTLTELRLKFQARYLKLCEETAKNGGIILLAPSAQRQATIFPTKETFLGQKSLPPVMIMIVRKLLATGIGNLYIVPIGVIPPKVHTAGINLFRLYRLHCPEYWDAQEFRTKFTVENFEYRFYCALAGCPGAEEFACPE